jgi:hypothetical protein
MNTVATLDTRQSVSVKVVILFFDGFLRIFSWLLHNSLFYLAFAFFMALPSISFPRTNHGNPAEISGLQLVGYTKHSLGFLHGIALLESSVVGQVGRVGRVFSRMAVFTVFPPTREALLLFMMERLPRSRE